MYFEKISDRQLGTMWLGVILLVVVAIAGATGAEAWADPGDFVTVCTDSVPPIPPPSAGMGARVAALDSMVACTERMEIQYVARAQLASNASMGMVALVTLVTCVTLVATWRWHGARRARHMDTHREPRT